MPQGLPLEISDLTKRYRGRAAVDHLSFTVQPGRVTGFLGPNGAGKTTTMRLLLGLASADGGSATVGGQTYAHIENPSLQVGSVLETSGVHGGHSGRNHLRWLAAASGIPDKRCDDVLELVGLTDASRRKVKGYSLGMKQRLGLAAALLGDPGVLILDEPANGLDPEAVAWLRGLLRTFGNEGRTVLVSSHLLAELALVVDDVVIIAQGQLRAAGSLASVLGPQGGDVLVSTPDAARFAAALASNPATAAAGVTVQDPWVAVAGSTPAVVGHIAFLEGVEIHELRERRPDLETVFLKLTAPIDPPPMDLPPPPMPQTLAGPDAPTTPEVTS
jgi:ABC-2 type transport system ATP-binding protein